MSVKASPLCTVIIPIFNCDQYIRASVESALEQSYKNLEIIIIDDCSSDETCRIITDIEAMDDRIKIIRNEANLGVAETRNNGFSVATGDYIALLDADDLWHQDKLEKQIDFMQQTHCDLSYTSHTYIDTDGNAIRKPNIIPEKTCLEDLLINNVICCSTVVLKRQLVKSFKMNSKYQHEDYALWIELLNNGYTARGVIEPLVEYRIHKNSRSHNKFRAAKGRWIIYRELLELDIIQSANAFIGYAWYGLKKHYWR